MPCPACGSHRSPHVCFPPPTACIGTTTKIFQIVECRNCRLIRLYPQPSPLELRDYYPPDYWFVPEATAADRLEQWYRRFVLRDHLHFVERALHGVRRDRAWCSTSAAAAACFSRCWPSAARKCAWSVSIFRSMPPTSPGGAPVSRPFARLFRALRFAPGSCAAITMFHVLEHLYDPASYLDAAHQLLRPDGRLILQVPNAACWQFLLLGERWNGIDVPRHLIDFRLSDIDSLLDHCGFEVLRHKHFSLRDNPAGMATSLAPVARSDGAPAAPVAETPRQRLWKDLLYVALVGASPAVHAARSRLPRRVHHHGGGPQEIVIYDRLARRSCPRPLRRYVQHFEASIEDAVDAFAESLARRRARARRRRGRRETTSSYFTAAALLRLRSGASATRRGIIRALDVRRRSGGSAVSRRDLRRVPERRDAGTRAASRRAWSANWRARSRPAAAC